MEEGAGFDLCLPLLYIIIHSHEVLETSPLENFIF